MFCICFCYKFNGLVKKLVLKNTIFFQHTANTAFITQKIFFNSSEEFPLYTEMYYNLLILSINYTII